MAKIYFSREEGTEMSEIKIRKGDKHFNLFYIQPDILYINTEEGEGTQLDEAKFYDYIKKYFDENM